MVSVMGVKGGYLFTYLDDVPVIVEDEPIIIVPQ